MILIPNLSVKKTKDDISVEKQKNNCIKVPSIPIKNNMNQSVLIPSIPGLKANASTPKAPSLKNKVEDKNNKSKYSLKPDVLNKPKFVFGKDDGPIVKKFGIKGNNKLNEVWKKYLNPSVLDKND